MATIYKCDKCDEAIKTGSNAIRYYTMLSSVAKKYNLPQEIYFCEECAKSFAKFFNKFLKRFLEKAH